MRVAIRRCATDCSIGSREGIWERIAKILERPLPRAAHLVLSSSTVVNFQTNPLLRYRDEDRQLFDVDELSSRAQVSRAFIRLCVSLGCPTCKGKLSQAMLLEWSFHNYERIRGAAGLKPMPTIEGVCGEALLKLMMGNAMITLVEFSELRSSNKADKQQLQRVRLAIEKTLERS